MGRRTGPAKAVVEMVLARSGGMCERCGGNGEQIHHRRPRGMGGTHRQETNMPANLVNLCRECHGWVESHRTQALADGWLIRQASPQSPSEVLLMLAWGSGYLDDLGEFRSEHPEDAAARWAEGTVPRRDRLDGAA